MFTLILSEVLQHSNPGAKWCIRGDQRDYANLEWMDQSQKPTEEVLLAGELAAAKVSRIARAKTEAMTRIYAAAPAWKQANAALGLYDAPGIQAIKDAIQAVRTAEEAAEVAINAMTDVQAVIDFTW